MVSFRTNTYRTNTYGIGVSTVRGKVRSKMINGHRYIALPHNSEYTIHLINNSPKRCNVDLFIDGKKMGGWRIDAQRKISLERPANLNKKFTFVKEGSWQAQMGGITSGASKNGLIEARFTPEKDRFYDDYYTNSEGNSFNNALPNSGSFSNSLRNSAPSNSLDNYSSGATVFGGNSHQQFTTASHMEEDTSNTVTHYVRLIVNGNCFGGDEGIVPPRIDATPWAQYGGYRSRHDGWESYHTGYYSDSDEESRYMVEMAN
jgi:hypothetical protein